MKKDINIVKEMKNGNKEKISFFKKQLEKELQSTNYSDQIKKKLINQVFNKALNSYSEETPILFSYYLKTLLKEKTKKRTYYPNPYFTSTDQEIIELYLYKDNNKYLTNENIALKLELSIEEVILTINKLKRSLKYKEKEKILEEIYPNAIELYRKRQNEIYQRKKIIRIKSNDNKSKYSNPSSLTAKEKELLNILIEPKNSHLRNEDIAKILQFNNLYDYKEAIIKLREKIKKYKLEDKIITNYGDIAILNISSSKTSLTKTEIEILKKSYFLEKGQTKYPTQQEIADSLFLKKTTLYKLKVKAINKIKNFNSCLINILNIWPTFEEDIIIKENFQKRNSVSLSENELNNIKNLCNNFNYLNTTNGISDGINMLNNSIFSNYTNNCSNQKQAILALRFGYYNNHPFSQEDISEIFEIPIDDIMNITKECIIKSKDNLAKKESKIKIKS